MTFSYDDYDDYFQQLMLMEGFRERAYRDAAGIWTVGYGSTFWHTNPPRRVKAGDTVTRDAAYQMLVTDIGRAWTAVSDLVTHGTEGQMAALASLAHNVGWHKLVGSTLIRLHEQRMFHAAADEFTKWNKARLRGVLTTMPGLVRRRAWEALLYLENSPAEVRGDKEPTASVPV